MRNPFEYGGVVSGEAFCNRERETADLVRAMENAQKLFVFSERRYGKTSLVRAALGKLPRKLWESLTLSQKRFLKGLAAESAGVKVFAGNFLSRYGLGSASNAQRAVQALLAKDIIDRDNGSFLITDRFFRLWIQSAQLA